jgi:prepilin-type N-terminal cleavage/methylation domain-containing protein
MDRKGFTLVELTITLVLVGILASLALIQYQKVGEKARAVEVELSMEKIRAGYQMLKFDEGDAFAAAWNPDIGAGSDAVWRQGGMDNPNANPKAYFAIDVWPAAFSAGSAPVNAARNVAVAFRRNIRAAYTADIDMTRWLYMDLDTGEVVKSDAYR